MPLSILNPILGPVSDLLDPIIAPLEDILGPILGNGQDDDDVLGSLLGVDGLLENLLGPLLGGGAPANVVDALAGQDGLVPNVLDRLLGAGIKGEVILGNIFASESLLGNLIARLQALPGVAQQVLDVVAGPNGLIDTLFGSLLSGDLSEAQLAGLIGENGRLVAELDPVLGGLLDPLAGPDAPLEAVGNLLKDLTGDGGTLDPLLGDEAVLGAVGDLVQSVVGLLVSSGSPGTTPGTPGDDDIDGTPGDDVIDGGDGDDVIDGGAGDDLISGGPGNDTIDGGPGNDVLLGGTGNDILRGGEGNDLLIGGEGNDLLEGGPGDDRLFGESGNDTLRGGSGNDFLSGGSGDDTIDGGTGNDRAAYTGQLDDYTIERQTDGSFKVTDTRPGGDGSDVLTNVEQIQFSDQMFALDLPPVEGDGDVAIAFRAILRLDADPAYVAATNSQIQAGTTTFAQTVEDLIDDAATSTIPALVVTAFLEGVTPSSERLDSLTAFSELQFDAYASKGVLDPTLGPYEALGYGMAQTSAFQGKYGGLSESAFISTSYEDVFDRSATTAQSAHFQSQIDYFQMIYGQAGIGANQATALAKGAVLGQMLGTAVNGEPGTQPYASLAESFLRDAADGDVQYQTPLVGFAPEAG